MKSIVISVDNEFQFRLLTANRILIESCAYMCACRVGGMQISDCLFDQGSVVFEMHEFKPRSNSVALQRQGT